MVFAWQMTFSVSDNCVDSLLHIISYFLTMIQYTVGFQTLCGVAESFPKTFFKAKKFVGLDSDDFVKFVVCPKCHKLFTYDQAFEHKDGKKQSNFCDYVRFPNHTQERMREACGAPLMKTVVSGNGKKQSLYPYKIFSYQSLRVSLERLLQREEIRTALSRDILINEDGYYDIYDGKLWSQLKDINGAPYFHDKRNLATIFNIDWFQPFDTSEHSVGALYMVLLNLPREIRYKKENVLLVGLIPGPNEPQLNVNSYLKPLVNELLSFWKGVYISERGEEALYRLVLMCVASDLPATRKCCGFMSYNAEKGICQINQFSPLVLSSLF